MAQLDKVLKSLKKKKCRDPQGYINELFQYDSLGSNLKQSVLTMLNKTKESLEIPLMMSNVNVVMIPKPGKTPLNDIKNQRGIFLLSVFRSMLMKMLLQDEYQKIDDFMSDSNAGGRKGRRTQDHLFIINGIIFDHARSKARNQISISIYDCELCFDSMWQEEVINDLFDAGVKNDKLALLHKVNQVNKVAVKTPNGLSERKEVNNIICQGEPWGPIECSLQIDKLGKESLNEYLDPYKYKNEVAIPALGWVDDLITVTESGYKTARMNSFINAKLAINKLRLGPKKCFVMHIGNKHDDFKNIELCIDGWSVRKVESFLTGKTELQDTLQEDMKEVSHIDSEKYLGQVISSDSKNTININNQRNKGIGIQNKIIQMLDKMPGGVFHFDIAEILRNALLISSMLSNSETWYGLTQLEKDQLEQIDEMLLRNLFSCSRNVPKDLLYLEMGLVPISYIIKERRLLFMHHILRQKEDSLVFRFFMAQLNSPTNNDWVSTVLEDLEMLDFQLEIGDIKEMKKGQFKAIVKEKVKSGAFQYLLNKKAGRISENAKGKLLEYNDLEMSEYLYTKENNFSIDEKKWLFKCRLEDIDISQKWNNENTLCPHCPNLEFDQKHLFECQYLLGKNEIITYIPKYEDMFIGDLEEQIYASRIMKEHYTMMKAFQTM